MNDNSIQQQIFESINKANRILIAAPQGLNGDALGAALGFSGFLKKLDKEVEIVSSGSVSSAFGFLPGVNEIKKELQISQSFVISVKTQNAPLDELSYEVKEDRVDIFLKPKTGRFSSGDVNFNNARFPYDLIFTLDVASLEQLGGIYEKNTDLFFETPIINIDHHPSNENYGVINLVDLTATSTAEIITSLIQDYEAGLLDENIATDLLTGIIVETNSFQHAKTTPRSFMKASALISTGAKHQDIIKELFKTKHLSLLKLWGRALARVKQALPLGLTYSMLSRADFEKSGAATEDAAGVIKELAANLSGSKLIMLLVEGERETTGYFFTHPTVRSQILASAFNAQMVNGSYGTFKLNGLNVLAAENEVIGRLEKIKSQAGLV